MKAVTALIAEDEAPQRRALQQQLRAAWPDLEIVAVCEDGLSALDADPALGDLAAIPARLNNRGTAPIDLAAAAHPGRPAAERHRGECHAVDQHEARQTQIHARPQCHRPGDTRRRAHQCDEDVSLLPVVP